MAVSKVCEHTYQAGKQWEGRTKGTPGPRR